MKRETKIFTDRDLATVTKIATERTIKRTTDGLRKDIKESS